MPFAREDLDSNLVSIGEELMVADSGGSLSSNALVHTNDSIIEVLAGAIFSRFDASLDKKGE